MPLSEEGQVMIRGLVMGPGTAYPITFFNPWKQLTRVSYSDSNPYADGGWSGPEFLEPVQIPLHVHPEGNSAAGWWGLHVELMKALRPIRTEPVEAEMHFRNGNQDFMMYARPRAIDPSVRNMTTGDVSTVCSLEALDPSIYSGGENGLHSIEMGLYKTTSGLAVPFGIPAFIPTVIEDGEKIITNVGMTPASLSIRITGPVEQPVISTSHPDTGSATLWFDLSLNANEYLEINTEDMSVYQNGTVSKLDLARGTFPMAFPGDTVVTYSAADYNETTKVRIEWRDRW